VTGQPRVALLVPFGNSEAPTESLSRRIVSAILLKRNELSGFLDLEVAAHLAFERTKPEDATYNRWLGCPLGSAPQAEELSISIAAVSNDHIYARPY